MAAPQWGLYRKKTATRMLQVNGPEDIPEWSDVLGPLVTKALVGEGFYVRGKQGNLYSPWGDWVAVDAEGSVYSIPAAVQAATYEPAVSQRIASDEAPRGSLASPCCHAALVAQGIENCTHKDYGVGVTVHVSCSKCDAAYGVPTHIFADIKNGAVANLIPG